MFGEHSFQLKRIPGAGKEGEHTSGEGRKGWSLILMVLCTNTLSLRVHVVPPPVRVVVVVVLELPLIDLLPRRRVRTVRRHSSFLVSFEMLI